MKNLGGGVAPWNVNQYRIAEIRGHPCVEGQPMVFYHYHALQTIGERGSGLVAIIPALGYSFRAETLRLLYRPYGAIIKQTHDDIMRKGYALTIDRVRYRLFVMIGTLLGRYLRIDMGEAVPLDPQLAIHTE
jgi:hypothetical protein